MGLVRTRKESNRPTRTHFLEAAEEDTCQDTKRNRPTNEHSLPRDGRAREMSGHGKKQTDRRALTFWRRQREKLVRTRKETHQPAHSPTGDGRGGHLSGHGKKQTDQRALTNWRRQSEAVVRKSKETDRPTRTHSLGMAERGTCQDTERNRPTDAHSLSGDSTGRHLSGHENDRPTNANSPTRYGRGKHMNTDRIRPIDTHSPPGDDRRTRLSKHGKNPTDRRALTSWRRQRETLVRTWKESDRMTGTHQLETEKGGTCQDTKGNRQTDADSQTGDGMREALVRTRKESDRRACTHILETAEGSTCQDGKTQTDRRALTS